MGVIDLAKFQFHEGPIKTKMAAVRTHHSSLFQFHEGPIKTVARIRERFRRKLFQFHEGPIKTNYYCPLWYSAVCFNSMKVRLKQADTAAIIFTLTKFQFHEGPIKT